MSDSPQEHPLRQAVIIASLLLFTVAVLNIFIGVITDAYNSEKGQVDNCHSFIMKRKKKNIHVE